VRTLAAFVAHNSMHNPCPILERGSMLDTDAETALQAVDEMPLVSVADLTRRAADGPVLAACVDEPHACSALGKSRTAPRGGDYRPI
jgi:hypothetical protein